MISARTRHRWSVVLQRSDGEIVETEFSAYWDPKQEETQDAVQTAAAVSAWWKSGKQHQFAPISAALQAT